MPIPALVATGLSLLPKLPALWESVAGLFGKSTPKKVEEDTKERVRWIGKN